MLAKVAMGGREERRWRQGEQTTAHLIPTGLGPEKPPPARSVDVPDQYTGQFYVGLGRWTQAERPEIHSIVPSK